MSWSGSARGTRRRRWKFLRRILLFNPLWLLQWRLSTAMALYVGSSVLVYSAFEGWAPWDCVYFAATTMTTVGFGDLAPRHPASRMFTCLSLLAALVFLTASLSKALNNLVAHEMEVANKALQKRFRGSLSDQDSLSGKDFRVRPATHGNLWQLFWSFVALVAFVALSAYAVGYVLNLEAVDALYFCVVTLTTTGYGDVVPRSLAAKAAISALCIVGVPLFGSIVASLAQAIHRRDRGRIHRIQGGLTAEQLVGMQQFAEAMHERGVYPEDMDLSDALAGERKVPPFEFCCFLLTQEGLITVDDMDLMLRNFKELDLQGDGYLWSKDLQRWDELRARGLDKREGA